MTRVPQHLPEALFPLLYSIGPCSTLSPSSRSHPVASEAFLAVCLTVSVSPSPRLRQLLGHRKMCRRGLLLHCLRGKAPQGQWSRHTALSSLCKKVQGWAGQTWPTKRSHRPVRISGNH